VGSALRAGFARVPWWFPGQTRSVRHLVELAVLPVLFRICSGFVTGCIARGMCWV